MTKKMQMTLKNTKFHDCRVVAVSTVLDSSDMISSGIPGLIDALKELTFIPNRNSTGSLLFAVDHCFPIKGQGTVMTGTVLQGKVCVNDVSLY